MTLTSKVTDVGTKDVYNYSWTALDSNGSTIGTEMGIGQTNFSFHNPTAGRVQITLTVTDQADPTATFTQQMLIVFQTDPIVHYSTDRADGTKPGFLFVDPAVQNLMVIGAAGGLLMDASRMTIPVVLDDGGIGNDTMLGGSGNDFILMHPTATDKTHPVPSDYGDGGAGNDTYILTALCDLTIVDGLDQNTVDFTPTGEGPQGYGVTFDLSQADGALQGVDGLNAGISQHIVSINDLGSEQALQADVDPADVNATPLGQGGGWFATLVGTQLADNLTAGSNSNIFAGGGNNNLFVGGNTNNATLTGGSGNDTLMINKDAESANINFNGDEGQNLLVNRGSVGAGGITFAGGSDADQLINAGSVTSINFNGDDGANLLINSGGGLGTVTTSTGTFLTIAGARPPLL